MQASILRDQSKLPEAYDTYQEAIDIFNQLLKEEEKLETWYRLVFCIKDQANILHLQENLTDAHATYQRAIDIYKKLIL